MKTLEKLLLKACGYTVTILFLFYIAGTVSEFTAPYIDFKTFSVILLFGALISLSDLILKIEKLSSPIKVLIHYAVLFCTFTATFLFSGNIAKRGATAIFSALIIFTFFYAIIFTLAYFLRKYVRKADSKIDKITLIKLEAKKDKTYKKLYKSED